MGLLGKGIKRKPDDIFNNDEMAWQFIKKLLGPAQRDDQQLERKRAIIDKLTCEGWEDFERLGGDFKLSLYNNLTQLCEKLRESSYISKLQDKTIIGLGGQFSAGKSSFINSLADAELVPEKQNPTTSVPTYIISGDIASRVLLTKNHYLIDLEVAEVKALTHEFKEKYNVDCSIFLERMLITSELWKYPNIAVLDTPGYTKPDSLESNGREKNIDREKAREELRSADYIIWVATVANGGLTNEDILFLKSLKNAKPILFVFNQADLKPASDIKEIMKHAQATIEQSNLSSYGVIAYTTLSEECYVREAERDALLKSGKEKLYTFFSEVLKSKEREDVEEEILELLDKLSKQLSKETEKIKGQQQELKNALMKIVYPKNCQNVLNLYQYYGQQLRLATTCEKFLKQQTKEIRELVCLKKK